MKITNRTAGRLVLAVGFASSFAVWYLRRHWHLEDSSLAFFLFISTCMLGASILRAAEDEVDSRGERRVRWYRIGSWPAWVRQPLFYGAMLGPLILQMAGVPFPSEVHNGMVAAFLIAFALDGVLGAVEAERTSAKWMGFGVSALAFVLVFVVLWAVTGS